MTDEKVVKETEAVEVIETEKPYTFRKLNSTDFFAMVRLIKKIGVHNFKKIAEDFTAPDGDEQDETMLYGVGVNIIFDIADVVFDRVAECEDELYNLLERVSNLSIEEIKNLDMDVFANMIIDFIKKDDFLAFIQAVLKSLNWEN